MKRLRAAMGPAGHRPISWLPHPSHLAFARRLAQLTALVWLGDSKRLYEVLDLTDESQILASGQRFLNQVARERFPVYSDLDLYDSVEEALWALDVIPVVPQGLSLDDLDAFSRDRKPLPEPLTLLLALFWRDVSRTARDTLTCWYPWLVPPDRLPRLAIADTLPSLTGPLAALPDAVRYAAGATGNPWLDVAAADMSHVEPPNWEADEVAYHTARGRKAEALLTRIRTLCAWVAGDEEPRLRFIWRTLQQTCEELPHDNA